MRFTTTFLICLLATSSVFSYSIEEIEDMDQIKKDMEEVQNDLGSLPSVTRTPPPAFSSTSIPTETEEPSPDTPIVVDPFVLLDLYNDPKIDKTSDVFKEECKKVIDEYYTCIPKQITAKNYDEVCDVYNGEKCVNIVKKKLSENEACKNGVDIAENYISILTGMMDSYCAKTNGEYCPLSKLSREGYITNKPYSTTNTDINDTCKSVVCTEKAINGFEATYKFFKIVFKDQPVAQGAITEVSHHIKNLKSNECQAQATANGAIQLKIGNLFVLTLGLFLYYFL